MPQWPNGLGQNLGDQLVTERPLHTNYKVSFVSSVTGSDTNTGKDPDAAFATLGHAVTDEGGTAGIIVLLSGHTETMTAAVTPPAGTIIVGAGSSGGRPTVKLTMNNPNTAMVIASANGVQVRNIWFCPNLQDSNISRVLFLSGADGLVSGCYFECGGHDLAGAVEVSTGGNNVTIDGCTFISTATSSAVRPSNGIQVSANVADLTVTNCIFSEGSNGYSGNAFNCNVTVTRLRGENLAFLLGADALIGASTTGIFMPTTTTGSSIVTWAV